MKLEHAFGPFQPSPNLAAALQYWAEHTPQNVACVHTDGEDFTREVTYAELDGLARAVAARLQGLQGQRVLLLFPPDQCVDYVAALFGCFYAGAVAVPAFPPRRSRNTTRIVAISNDAGAAVALTVDSVVDRMHDLSDDEAGTLKRLGHISLNGLDLAEGQGIPLPTIAESDLAVLQYTSGSTGTPKGVMLTHRNLVANSEFIAFSFQTNYRCRGFSWLPTYHDMGLVGGIIMPLYIGSVAIFMSPLSFLARPVRWLKMLSKHKVNISGGPNFAYELCAERINDKDLEGLDLSHWKVAYNGAEPIRPATLDRFTQRMAPYGFRRDAFLPCYGMAETTLIVTGRTQVQEPVVKWFGTNELNERRVVDAVAGSDKGRPLVGCGQVLPNEDVLIVDPDSHTAMPPAEIGEIWIHSECVGQGYWNKEEITRDTFQATVAGASEPHYLRTGDLGFIRDGELFVTGRVKDLIIVRGVNRYPQDIEETVEQSSDRLNPGGAAAFSIDDDGQERLVVVCEVERKRGGEWEQVIQQVRRRVTAVHELPPDAVILVRFGSVPTTSSGKVQRHACRAAFMDGDLRVISQWKSWSNGHAAPPAPPRVESSPQRSPEPNPQVAEQVMEHVRAVAKERAGQLALDSNIVLDCGLDSLERLQIANSLEETFGGRFPDDVLADIETVREVALAIEQHMGAKPVQSKISSEVDLGPRPDGYEAPEEFFDFSKMPEYLRLRQMKALMESSGAPNPYFSVHQSITNDTTTIDGHELISFASYNYLGMSGDEAVIRATQEAVAQFGTSVSASRLVSGEKTLHGELERKLADFIGAESSLVFVGGHSTNETVIGHLMGPGDLILHDSLAHNSIVQGALLSGARRRAFPHNDWRALDEVLSEIRHGYRKVLVVIEGVYSMDGDFPDLSKFVEVKRRHGCLLMVDEAHSIGTMGPRGRGIGEHFELDSRAIDIWMGTLSKSFGSCGGYIAGSAALVDYLKYTAPGFVYSVGLSPPNTAAALAALRLLEEEPERVAKLQTVSRMFLTLARERGLNTGFSNNTPVIPVIIGNSMHAMMLSHQLFQRGINVQPIMYPAVEEERARLRFFITACHTPDQIRQTVQATCEELAKIDPRYVKDPPNNDESSQVRRPL